jgi:hypothetical protein
MADFDPNRNKMSACLERINDLKKKLKIDDSKIYTSKDFAGIWNEKSALIDNIPGGFNKVILPFMTTGEATFYISSAGPNTEVPKHSHKEGAGIRFIVSGSMIYNGQELTEGDWMYMPAGAVYEFKVGPRGVTIFYCYQCCCA